MTPKSLNVVKKSRKEDALALAQLIFDVYKEEKLSGKIKGMKDQAEQTKIITKKGTL